MRNAKKQRVLTISLLGGLEIIRDGEPVAAFVSRKADALLAYLACQPRPFPRDTLAAIFWPENDQSRALANLSVVLSSLRKQLRPYLLADRHTIAFNPATDYTLDVAQFEEAIAQARVQQQKRGKLTRTVAAQLETAVAFYQGDFLAGFSLRNTPEFESWVLLQQERLRVLALDALAELIDFHLQRRQFSRGIVTAQHLLSLDPLREAAHRQLMRLYFQDGQRPQALAQYETCRQLLADEVGVPPDEETERLYEMIRAGAGKQDPLPDSAADPALAASLVAGRYAPQVQIGQGAMGTVYRGVDVETGQLVAIKVLQPQALSSSPGSLDRFVQEAETLRQLNHPNVVQMLGIGTLAGRQAIVMEFVAGGDLQQWARQWDVVPLADALTIALELADALARTHHLHVVHRDLKPANVLIAADGSPRLADFGLARLRDSRRLTNTEGIVGTLAYLSPEACQGRPPDVGNDVWAFGVLLYELLTGRHPFAGESAAATLNAILHQPLPDLGRDRPDAPVALAHLLQRLLARDPAQRLASMRQVSAELEAILHQLGVTGRSSVPLVAAAAPPVAHRSPVAPLPQRHNLPAVQTLFVGREAELAQIDAWLADANGRLLTIVGPGGVGKTRLALEAARRHLGEFGDGVWHVPLVSLPERAEIVTAIAEAIGLSFKAAPDPTEQLLAFLRPREVLLLLDNVEHLLSPANLDLLAALGQTAPEVRLLVTSRERVSLQAEALLSLRGLPLPATAAPGDLEAAPSAVLFMARLRQLRSDFELAGQETAVAQLCRLVDGLPLALELAATWGSVLSVTEIVTEIEQGLDVLATTLHDVPARHRSLRAVFDYSWQLLSAAERDVYRRLAVCRGGFTRAAARAIAGATLPQLAALVDKSLMRLDADVPLTVARYRRHPLLIQFAVEQLAQETAVQQEVQQRHAQYFADYLQQRLPRLHGAEPKEGVREIEVEAENVRAAWQWAAAAKEYLILQQMVPAFSRYLSDRSRYQDALVLLRETTSLLEQFPAAAERDAAISLLQIEQSHFLYQTGQYAEALRVIQSALAHARRLDRPVYVARALKQLGDVTHDQGKRPEAMAYLKEAESLSRQVNDPALRLVVLNSLGNVSVSMGEYEQAQEIFTEAIEIAEGMGNRTRIAILWNNLGIVANRFEDFREALRTYRKANELFQEVGHDWGIAASAHNIGMGHVGLEEYDQAQKYIEQSITQHRKIGHRRGIVGGLAVMGTIYHARGELQQARRYFLQSLELAQEVGVKWAAVAALAEFGQLELKDGNSEWGITLLSFAVNHEAVEAVTRDEGEKILEELQAERPQLWATAVAQAETFTLDSLIAALKQRHPL